MSNNNDASVQYESERAEPNNPLTQLFAGLETDEQEESIGEVKDEAIEGKVPDDTEQPERSFFQKAGAVAADIGEGIIEAPGQIAGGFLDATKELAQTMESILPLGTTSGEDVSEDSFLKVEKGNSATGGLIRGVSQFLTGFLPASKLLGVAGKSAGLVKSMTAGAIADVTVFDAHEGRLSDLVESNPDLSNPVTKYLASDPEDSEAEGKFKNGLEGLLVGGVLESFVKAVKLIKSRKGNKETLDAKNKVATDERKLREAEESDPELIAQINAKLEGKTKITGSTKSKKKPTKTEEKDPDKFAANINLKRLDTTEGVKEAIKVTADKFKAKIDEARRGKISNEETKKLADELNLTVEEMLDTKTGKASNAEEILAQRKLHLAAQEKATELGVKAQESGELIDRLTAIKAQNIANGLKEKTAASAAEAGRALQSLNIIAKVDEPQRQAIKEILDRGGKVSDQTRDALDGATNPDQVAAIVKLATKPEWFEAPLEYWYNALLSAPSTHIINTLGNTLNGVWGLGNRLVTPAIGAIHGDKETTLNEAVQSFYGMGKGLIAGFADAGSALKNSGFSKYDNTTIERAGKGVKKAISAENFNKTGMAGKAIDYFGSAVRTPGRMLNASDHFFKAINFQMELRALSYRKAISEGLEGEAASIRMKQIIDDPPKELSEQAEQFEKLMTFTNDLGKAGQGLQQAANNFPPLKLLMPFVRTPVNLIKVAVRNSPFAKVSSAYRDDVEAGGARRDRAQANAAMGSSLMFATTMIAGEGNITGGGPANPALRGILKTNGWQPYSIKIGEKWHAYNRADPFGTVMSMAADFSELSGSGSDADLADLAQTAVLSTMKNVGDKTYLKGINDFFKAYASIDSDPEGEERMLSRFGGNLLSTVVPSVVNAARKALDPVSRASDDQNFIYNAIDKMKARTPGLSESLPPVLNLFGDPVFNTAGAWERALSPIYTSDIKHDPIIEELSAIEVPIRMPSKTIKGIRLSPQEYHDFVKVTNVLDGNEPTYKEALAELFADEDYQDGTVDLKQELVKRLTFGYRKIAQAVYLEQNPEFKLKHEQKLAERALALGGEEE